jgi:[acyl-carrier-protein] S-malonyltransferase
MLCILCPGQGSQQAGMFARLRRDPVAAALLDRAIREKWVTDDVAAWLTAPAADEALLHIDHFAQPLLCLHQQAIWAAVSPHVGRVSLFAGLSLGELSAAACAGALDTRSVLGVAARRAELMDAAAPPGCLVVVLGLDRDAIAALCGETESVIAIQSGPDHCTLGCLALRRDALIQAALVRGASRVIPLAVTVASHTPWMQPAAEPFRACLQAAHLTRPHAPILAGTTGRRVWSPDVLVSSLCDQLHTTLRWDLCIEAALSSGVRTYLELGPGSVLSHAILTHDPTIAARSVDEFSNVSEAATWAGRN